jgi:tRNA(Arg) A34 adenosine deaminase TadA
MTTYERLARLAIDLARQARAAGNHPFGALLALDGEVILTAENTVMCSELFARAAEHVTITGPLLVSEAREVHLGYWLPPAV